MDVEKIGDSVEVRSLTSPIMVTVHVDQMRVGLYMVICTVERTLGDGGWWRYCQEERQRDGGGGDRRQRAVGEGAGRAGKIRR